MKRLLALLLVLCLLFSCAWAEEASRDPSNDIVILYTNDVHCGVEEGWGYAGVYAVREYYRKNHKEGHVFLVDCGDAVQGEAIGLMTSGEAILDIMNVMDYDAVTLGNHEFDFGTNQLDKLLGMAKFPYVCCNFFKDGKQVLPSYLIKEADGVKIAFVGVVTPLTMRTSLPASVKNEKGEYVFSFAGGKDGQELYDTVQKAVDEARAEGADYVILLAHLGNQAEYGPYQYAKLIENTTGIDAMLDGHSHDTDQAVVKNKEGKDVVRTSSGTKLANIGVLTITAEGKISSELLQWNQAAGAPALLGVQNAAADEAAAVEKEINENLGQKVAESPFVLYVNDPTARDEEGNPVRIIRQAETNLGDLVADALLQQAGDGDIAFINSGAIRDALPSGTITENNVITVLPFQSYVMTVELSGQTVLDALEWSAHVVSGEFGGFLQVSGLTYEINGQIPSPVVEDENGFFDYVDETKERRVRNVKVKGEDLDPQKTYRVVSIDFHIMGGDGYSMYDGAKIVSLLDKLAYQALIDYMRDALGGVVSADYENPYGQGRIVSADAGE